MDAETPKIATLAFQRAINFGAVLQTYALQQAIKAFGTDVEVLDYRCESEEKRYYRIPRNPKTLVGRIIKWPVRHKKMERFAQFRDEYLVMSDPVDKKTVADYCKRYSKIIAGSDQVWNLKLTEDTAYFLDFIDDPARKASYAASLGTAEWDADEEALARNLLSDYSFISVRERTSGEYLTKLLDREVHTVCDPVLLLTPEQWRPLAVKPDVSRPYLLIYTLGPIANDFMQWARTMADKKGLDLIALHGNKVAYPNITNIRDAGPREFLGYLANADYVITNSFHGTCFSIIFNKQFSWFQSNIEDQRARARSIRIADVLGELGLEERHATGTSAIPEDIDYDAVNTRLKAFRQPSLMQLEKIVRSAEPETDR